MKALYIIGFYLLFGAIGGSEKGNLTLSQCILLSAIAFIILFVTATLDKPTKSKKPRQSCNFGKAVEQRHEVLK
jgi:hypothetical protein